MSNVTLLKTTAVRAPVAFVLLQLQPIVTVLAVSADRDLLQREAEALLAVWRERRNDQRSFECVIRPAPVIAA